MTDLKAILEAANITKALIVDDAIDDTPLPADLSSDGDQWTHFFDDLSGLEQTALTEAFPDYANTEAEDLQNSARFVECLWLNKDIIAPKLCRDLFARYSADMQADMGHLNMLKALLEGAGLECKRVGREFSAEVADADIIFMDLFLCSAQRPDDIKASIEGLAKGIEARKTKPPLVILMSRSQRLEEKRAEFREGTRLFESTFRILVKADIQVDGVVQRLVGRLATHYQKSLKLSEFVCAWEEGLDAAKNQTTKLIRKLGLSDLAQINRLLLAAEGEPMGSYLVDVFDKVLQHEIEGNADIIDSALALNDLDTSMFPAPFVPGANDLLELVEHSLFHNRARLKLPGAVESSVSFGDVLRRRPHPPVAIVAAPAEHSDSANPIAAGDSAISAVTTKPAVLPDITDNMVMTVLSPACDLARDGKVKRVLLLVGELVTLKTEAWSAKSDGARTPVFDMGDGIRRSIRWDVKHVHTLSHAELDEMLNLEHPIFDKVARLRDLHALELQQKLLSSMGRVGLAAPMPATHAVRVEAFTVGADKKLRKLDIASLADGGVCFIGRNSDGGKPEEKLVLTELACEDICRAIDQIDPESVNERSKDILIAIQKSNMLLQTLEQGITIGNTNNKNFVEFKSTAGITQGLITRNRSEIDKISLVGKELQFSGLVLIAHDGLKEEPSAQAESEAPAVDAVTVSSIAAYPGARQDQKEEPGATVPATDVTISGPIADAPK